jgi:transposase
VVVVDNAGWHRAKRLVVPPNVRLHFLPPCTPELQPAERRWPLIREAVANDTFDTLDVLPQRVIRRCRWLVDDRTTAQRATGFRWAINPEE